MKKKFLTFIMAICFVIPCAFMFVACENNASKITISFETNTEISCKFKVVKDNDGNDSNLQLYFTDSQTYINPTISLKKGSKFSIEELLYVKNGYKVDKIYYKDGSGKEIVVYTYKEGDYHQSGNTMLTQVASINGYVSCTGNYEQYIILPNYDISLTVETSVLVGHYGPTDPLIYNLSLTSSNDEYGTVKGAGTYEKDSYVDIKAEANNGYYFEKWSDDSTELARRIRVDKDISLVAYFKIGSRFDKNGKTVIAEYGNIEYTGSGYSKTLKITPQNKVKFSFWSTDEIEIYSTSTEIKFDGMHDGILQKDAYFIANNTACGYYIGWEERVSGCSEDCNYGVIGLSEVLSRNWAVNAYVYNSQLKNMAKTGTFISTDNKITEYYDVSLTYDKNQLYVERAGIIFESKGIYYVSFASKSDLFPKATASVSPDGYKFTYKHTAL